MVWNLTFYQEDCPKWHSVPFILFSSIRSVEPMRILSLVQSVFLWPTFYSSHFVRLVVFLVVYMHLRVWHILYDL